MPARLGPREVHERLLAVCRAIRAASDELSAADREIGDGDHGVTMARGFTAAEEALLAAGPTPPGEQFRAVGMALMSRCGGAAGVVFGTLFLSMAREIRGNDIDAEDLCRALHAALEAVARRGGAKPGDKTMLDALAPAAEAACAEPEAEIDALLAKVAEAAARGAEATRAMLPRTGKAKTLGERALGHVDPGALSLARIFEAFAGIDAAPREKGVSPGDAATGNRKGTR